MKTRLLLFGLAFWGLISCSRTDDIDPQIYINSDNSIHYRGYQYEDAGAVAADNYTCGLNEEIQTTNLVDTSRYGTYQVIYSVTDESGNTAEAIRNVDIVLPVEDYYSLEYQAYDTCTSGIYIYTGLIQDCDCDNFEVTVGNISNFGLSALFTLPVSGNYNEILTLDTTKADVDFLGTGIMSPTADMITWQYSISDSISTDVCTSTWIRE